MLFIVKPRRPPRTTLIPYTTLFRSSRHPRGGSRGRARALRYEFGAKHRAHRRLPSGLLSRWNDLHRRDGARPTRRWRSRSEEHTSELQSHSDLVCRLLLEKKKKYIN